MQQRNELSEKVNHKDKNSGQNLDLRNVHFRGSVETLWLSILSMLQRKMLLLFILGKLNHAYKLDFQETCLINNYIQYKENPRPNAINT